MTRGLRVAIVALAVAVLLQSGAGAQTLAYSLFGQYLESLRVNFGIPGLSAVIVQDGHVVSATGLGFRDIEAAQRATADTPYPLADLTQPFTATLLMDCVERGELPHINLPIGNWVPGDANPGATLRQLLSHAKPNGPSGFSYDPARYSVLAIPVAACWELPFQKVLAQEILDRSMRDAVPGLDILSTPLSVRDLFDENKLGQYAAALERMATPYKVDRRGRATRSDMPPAAVDGAHGLVASALDLAAFSADLDAQLYLGRDTLNESWTNVTHNGAAIPTGLGWFVQTYQGEKLVWAFGHSPDAFSSLILKIPGRRLTLILLANSDGLSAPFALGDGDVTSSIFARTFLRLFL
jgi:CubicO group peptidase (beta-lactamase class C family)